MSDSKKPQDDYEPPQVEKIPTEAGPAVTAAGKTLPGDSS